MQANAKFDSHESIRLLKYAVRFNLQYPKEITGETKIQRPFLTYFCHQLIDLAKAHSTFRYILEDEETGQEKLLVRTLLFRSHPENRNQMFSIHKCY